jgi:hypothetical protein
VCCSFHTFKSIGWRRFPAFEIHDGKCASANLGRKVENWDTTTVLFIDILYATLAPARS